MGKLIYFSNISLDGYVEDAKGDFSWGIPKDEEIHRWIFAHVQAFHTCLYSETVYKNMLYWETAEKGEDQREFVLEFTRRWKAAEKIVYSKTLTEVQSSNSRIEREFDPARVRELKTKAAGDLCVAGTDLAAQALHAGLVDEVQVRICPVLVGGGTRFLPEVFRRNLELLEEKRFGCGDLFLRYRVKAE